MIIIYGFDPFLMLSPHQALVGCIRREGKASFIQIGETTLPYISLGTMPMLFVNGKEAGWDDFSQL